MHSRRVVPEEERLVRFDLLLHPAKCACSDFLIDGFHALLGQRTCVFNRLLAYSAKAWIRRWVILVSRQAMEHASGPKSLQEPRLLRIVGQFRFFFGVKVIEIAEELVKSMHGRQEFIPIAEMVFAKLTGGIAERLEHVGDGRVFGLKSYRRAGHSDLGQAGAERVLAGDEGGASSGAALLTVPVSQGYALVGDAVDVGGVVTHRAEAEAADIPDADVIAPKDENIRLFCGHGYVPFIRLSVLRLEVSTNDPFSYLVVTALWVSAYCHFLRRDI